MPGMSFGKFHVAILWCTVFLPICPTSPRTVILDPVPKMVAGKTYTLTCRVSHVGPIRNATVTFLKGKDKLHTETFRNRTPNSMKLVVTHNYTAQPGDYKENITCRAALNLTPEGPLLKKASLDKPKSSVVNFPEQVTIELQKSSNGTSGTYDLVCRVSRVAPVRNLTVTFVKGGETLHTQKLHNYTRPQRANVTVTHPITLRPQDHGQTVACHVTLDFSPDEKPFTAISSNKVELSTAETYRAIAVASSSIALLAGVLVGILLRPLCGAPRSGREEKNQNEAKGLVGMGRSYL